MKFDGWKLLAMMRSGADHAEHRAPAMLAKTDQIA